MQKYQENIIGRVNGALAPMKDVQVTVTDTATNLLAALYSDNGVTPLPQPLYTDETGLFAFYAADGKYTLTYSGKRLTTTAREIILDDPSDNPYLSEQTLALQNGAAKVGFGLRTVKDKLAEVVSVEDKGAKGDGVTNDVGAFASAYDATPAGGTINVGPGSFLGAAASGLKAVLWKCAGALNGAGNAPLNLPGVVETFFERRKLIRQSQSAANDYATLQVQRAATHTGGTPGYVNAGLRSDIEVGTNVANFEWALLGSVKNSATAGENVGVYGQGVKMTAATGPTFGGTFEGRDSSGAANPTSGLIGAEVDVFANGTDANGRRVVLDVVIGRADPAGDQCEAAYGVRVGPQNGNFAAGRAKRAFVAAIDTEVGFDAKDCTFSAGGVAYRMAINHQFSLVATNNRTFGYTSAGWQYFVSGVGKWTVADDGTMKLTNDIHINGVKVLTSRRTGFTNQMTGVANQAAAYDTSTITHVQLAERVKALQDALTTHGLIGP